MKSIYNPGQNSWDIYKGNDLWKWRISKGKRTMRNKTSKASKCTDKHDKKSKYEQLMQAVAAYVWVSLLPTYCSYFIEF